MYFRTIAIILLVVFALIMLWPLVRTARKKATDKYEEFVDTTGENKKVDDKDPRP